MPSASCHTASMSAQVVFCGEVLKANRMLQSFQTPSRHPDAGIADLPCRGRRAAARRRATRDHGPAGRELAVGECGPAEGCGLGRADRAHRGVEAPGRGPADGTPAEYRWGWAGRSGRAWRGAPGGVRVPDRVVPVLAGGTGPRRLQLRAVRGE